MIKFGSGDPKRIQHFVKVASFARTIGEVEVLPASVFFMLITAPVVHDIGIHPALKKYGSYPGKSQEQEGGSAPT